MKTLILVDSFFGNTRKIAESIQASIPGSELKNMVDAVELGFKIPELLIIGSPTRGFRPSPLTQEFLKELPDKALEGVFVAAFDTRIALHEIKNGLLRFIIKKGGYADKHIHKRLIKKGGIPIIENDGFCVTDTEGPLMEGEIERSISWAQSILKKAEEKMDPVS